MDDVIQYQRLASGYVPGLSEAGTPAPVVAPATSPNFGSPAASTAELQNCRVLRPVAVGIYDILVGGNNPAPVGIGGTLETSPPLVAPAAATIVATQGRVSVNVRSILAAANPPAIAGGSPQVTHAIFYGATLGPVPLYTGFLNSQIVRVIFTAADVLADCDFDFSIERVIDPLQEP